MADLRLGERLETDADLVAVVCPGGYPLEQAEVDLADDLGVASGCRTERTGTQADPAVGRLRVEAELPGHAGQQGAGVAVRPACGGP